jgi:hypothetical protein
MSEAGIKPEPGETARTEPDTQEGSAGRFTSEMAACCGPDMAKMMQSCPCASVMKGRWKTALVLCSLLFLTFIVCQVGGILGMVVFFRAF